MLLDLNDTLALLILNNLILYLGCIVFCLISNNDPMYVISYDVVRVVERRG